MINSAWIEERSRRAYEGLLIRYPYGVEVELAKRMNCEELANLVHIPHIRQTHANFPLNFLCLLLKYVHTYKLTWVMTSF